MDGSAGSRGGLKSASWKSGSAGRYIQEQHTGLSLSSSPYGPGKKDARGQTQKNKKNTGEQLAPDMPSQANSYNLAKGTRRHADEADPEQIKIVQAGRSLYEYGSQTCNRIHDAHVATGTIGIPVPEQSVHAERRADHGDGGADNAAHDPCGNPQRHGLGNMIFCRLPKK